jgi:hypothetical protein
MYSEFPVRKRAFFIIRSYAMDGVGCCLRFFCYPSIRLTVTVTVPVPVPTLTVNRSFTVHVSHPELNPRIRGEKPASKRLSYSIWPKYSVMTAKMTLYVKKIHGTKNTREVSRVITINM